MTQDLVLLGGGHAHALVLKSWGMRPLAGVRLTLVDPAPSTAYTGMLPGFVGGHYARTDLEIDLVRLARFAGARFIHGAATGIDPEHKRIQIDGHAPLEYDVASINIGARADIDGLPGRAHLVPVRPLSKFAASWQQWLETSPKGSPIVILGAGVGGIELALAMSFRCPASPITLVDPGSPATGVSPRSARVLMRAVEKAGITFIADRPLSVTAQSVTLTSGQEIPSTFTVATAGVRARDWPEQCGLQTANGFIAVDDHLRVLGQKNLFAAGDCAEMVQDPRPKAGVYAVRQAPILINNFRAILGNGTARHFRPQRDFLRLISLGGKSALANRSGMTTTGGWVWNWKDRIDRKFMDRLSSFPQMDGSGAPRDVARGVSDLLDGPPICGGCGAKVGPGTLAAALTKLPAPERADVLSTPGDDAAILAINGQKQVLTTDHLRGFSHDPALVGRVAAIHALGDIDAMGATPQAALATIILPPLSVELERRTLDDIMAAATGVFAARGVQIVGGHTTQGSELTIGFTITGLADTPITVGGALTGDALVLTKPIGSGVLFAGEMAAKANGNDVADLWTRLCQSQAGAAEILHHAHAMTDVTGFGLAGHLLNICTSSGVGADLSPHDVPIYAGAVDLARAGVRSSLFDANYNAAAPKISGLTQSPEHALLFDPQTAGGLLACIDPEKEIDTLNALTAAGYTAAVIGHITNGPAGIKITG